MLALLSILVTTSSGIHLTFSSIGLGPAEIAQLAATRWDFNLAIIRSLARQRAHAEAGVILLVIGISTQLAAITFDHHQKLNARSVAIALAVTVLLVLSSSMLVRFRSRQITVAAQSVLKRSS